MLSLFFVSLILTIYYNLTLDKKSDCSLSFAIFYPFLISTVVSLFSNLLVYKFHIPLPHKSARNCLGCIQAPHYALYLPAMESVILIVNEIILYFLSNLNSLILYKITQILIFFHLFLLFLCSIASLPLYGRYLDLYGNPKKMLPGLGLLLLVAVFNWFYF